MQELINAFVRLSAAMTVYSMQQMQTAVESMDPKDSVNKLRLMIDSMADALTAQIEESKKATVNNITNIGSDVVNRTFDTISASGMKAGSLMETTQEVLRKTTEQISGMMKPEDKKEDKPSSGEPKAAEELVAAA